MYAGSPARPSATKNASVPARAGQTGLSSPLTCPPRWARRGHVRRGGSGEMGLGLPSPRSRDMRLLLAGLPLDEVTTSNDHQRHRLGRCCCSINSSPRSRCVAGSQLRGTIQNDILKEYVSAWHVHLPTTTLHASRGGHLRLLPPKRCQLEHHLHLGVHIREAGSTAVQEIAFTLANASPTWRPLSPRGLN